MTYSRLRRRGPATVENVVENFVRKSLDDSPNWCTFAADTQSPHQGSADGEKKIVFNQP